MAVEYSILKVAGLNYTIALLMEILLMMEGVSILPMGGVRITMV